MEAGSFMLHLFLAGEYKMINVGNIIGIGISIILISSCSSQQELQLIADMNKEMVAAQSTVQQIPTLSIKCGESSDACKGLAVNYIHPSDRQRVQFQNITTKNDVWLKNTPSIVSGLKFLAGAWAATDIFRNISGGFGEKNYSSNSNTTVEGEGNTLNADRTTINATNNDFDLQFESQPEVIAE